MASFYAAGRVTSYTWSGMGRRAWIATGALIGVCVTYLVLDIAWSYGVFQRVPATRDPRLIGRWTAQSKFGGPRLVEFHADGRAQTPSTTNARAFWGTSDGVLYVKQRSAGEGWNLASARYTVQKGGASVLTNPGGSFFMIPEKMSRRP
jgi:hypothetical protein